MGSRAVKRIADVSKLRTYQFPQVCVLSHSTDTFYLVLSNQLLVCGTSTMIAKSHSVVKQMWYLRPCMFLNCIVLSMLESNIYIYLVLIEKYLEIVGCWSHGSSCATSFVHQGMKFIFYLHHLYPQSRVLSTSIFQCILIL